MRSSTLGLAALVMLLMLPSSSYAQNPNGLPSDPGANSPSGTVYELPLDAGRKDAAPRQQRRSSASRDTDGSKGGGSGSKGSDSKGAGGSAGSNQSGGSGDGTANSGSDSSIRSENNFGSSSRVPGVDDDAQASTGGASGGSGSSSDNAGETGKAGGSSATESDDQANLAAASTDGDGPSWTLILPLILLLVLIGATTGILAGRARRQ